MDYVVDRVHMVRSADGTHQHIDAVCLQGSSEHVSRAQVIASMRAGYRWFTFGGGRYASIEPARCRHCSIAYITTTPDATTLNNLDKLPRC